MTLEHQNWPLLCLAYMCYGAYRLAGDSAEDRKEGLRTVLISLAPVALLGLYHAFVPIRASYGAATAYAFFAAPVLAFSASVVLTTAYYNRKPLRLSERLRERRGEAGKFLVDFRDENGVRTTVDRSLGGHVKLSRSVRKLVALRGAQPVAIQWKQNSVYGESVSFGTLHRIAYQA